MENIADKNLIAKWKKQGYESLCCLRCIQTRDTNFGTNCICRVPKAKLEEVSMLSPCYNLKYSSTASKSQPFQRELLSYHFFIKVHLVVLGISGFRVNDT